MREGPTTRGADRLDYPVDNAGMPNHIGFAESTGEVPDRIHAASFKGVLFLTRKLSRV